MVKAAQIIAFSFSSLDTLAEATGAGLSPAMRLRYRGCANNLNRFCQQKESALAARLACHPPSPDAEPIQDLPDADVEAAVQIAASSILVHRDHLLKPRSPVPPPR